MLQHTILLPDRLNCSCLNKRPNHNIPYALDWIDISRTKYLIGYFWQSHFNRNSLGNWDVSRVTSMGYTFAWSRYNYPLNSWDVGSVTSITGIFQYSQYNSTLNI